MQSVDTIQATYNATAGQWRASFCGLLQVAFGAATATAAARRLLEYTQAERGTYTLLSGNERDSGTAIVQFVTWDPPELLLPCDDCRGTGEYRGLTESGPCKACGGRGAVAG